MRREFTSRRYQCWFPPHRSPCLLISTLLDTAGAFLRIGERGWIPVGSRLERSAGIYVAFSRPTPAGSSYRITGRSDGPQVTTELIDKSNAAQGEGKATLFFDCTPADVAVTAAGVTVAEAAVLDVIPFQRTMFAVTPGGSRVYRATASGQGTTFDCNGLTVTARAGLGTTDDLEISRFHRFNPETRTFDSGIGPIHLPSDLDIAVRRFAMQIQDSVPLRATLDHTVDPVTTVQPGAVGFVLVPAALAPVAIAPSVTGTPSLTPQIGAAPGPLPAAVRAFLGDGGAVQVEFPADQPPEQQATVTITFMVGPDAASAVPVRCAVTVNPFFTLEAVGGGGFSVARGASIVLRASDGTSLQAVQTIPGVTFTEAGGEITIAIDAGFGPSSLTVLVRAAADPQRFARRTLAVT